MTTNRAPAANAGLSRLDLLVVLAVVFFLALLTSPAWGNGRVPDRLLCLDNLRRLSAAWLMYAEDNGGCFPTNYAVGGTVGVVASSWVAGWMSWDTNPDNTNAAKLVSPRYALLGPYTGGDASMFKCPADRTLSRAQTARGWTERVRSYAMNVYIGAGNENAVLVDSTWSRFASAADFRLLTPQRAFVFVEEHPDSINDGTFLPPYSSTSQWIDLPAAFHEGACDFAFADGHVESRRWAGPVGAAPISFQFPNIRILPNDPDAQWIRERTSERR